MSASNTVTILVLDKEYQVHCPPEQRDALQRAALELDQRMRTIRQGGNVIGLERIAIMAALNLSYDLLDTQHQATENAVDSEDLERLDQKVFQALQDLTSSN
ncbi:MAG: cell division protein ZapA [Porticoccaceae bacterium]|nr:cell division protein ZapA [Porticoccaceae bacterium]OUS10102.1 cell division protein ZapA [Gammaproteobacteria bacterium 54_18_T64]